MASSKVKGLIVEIGGDTSGLQKALEKVNNTTNKLQRELKNIDKSLKFDPKNTELLQQKQKILNDEIAITSKKLEELKQHQIEVKDSGETLSKEQQEKYRNLQREIINTQNKLKDLQVQASKWTTAGKSLEEYGDKIQKISDKINSLGNKLTIGLTVPLVTAGVVGVQSAAKQEAAVQQVEKIYGDAAKTIKDFAENTAISFNMSTSDAYKYSQIYGNLIQSITDDQVENAKYTQELLKASSVIASATGRTMEDVMDRIRSGLLGNTEAIEDLGVNVNVAMIESTDAFKQFAGDKSWLQLDFQTQQQIRLFAILEQTTKKYGDEVNKNTASDIQNLTAKFTNLTSKLNKKLLPIADKLIDKADDFLDKLDDLTDEEADNIIKVGLMVAAAGPLVKILGTTVKVIGTTTKGVGLFSQAIAVATNKTNSNITSVNNLAKVFTALASPIGIATTIITASTAALIYFASKETEAQKKAKEFADEMKNSKQTLLEYNKEIDDATNSNLAQINSVSKLKDELIILVDENGRVTDSNKARVDFILNQLNDALGTEYELNGNIVQSYKELQKEIDNTIEKKKAEIILNGQEEKYSNAIENQTQAVEDLKTAHDNLGMSLQDAQKKYEELINKKNEYEKSGKIYNSDYMNTGKEIQSLEDLMNAYKDAESIVKQYTEDKKLYEENYALFVEGKYNEISNTIKTTTQNWTDVSLETIKNSIIEQQKSLNDYKKIYEDTGNEIALEQQKQAQENLNNLANELISRTSRIEELGTDEIEAWKALGNNSFEEYKKALSQMPVEMQQKIQETTGIIIEDSLVKDATKELGKSATEEFNKNVDGKKWGTDLVKELSNSMVSSPSKGIVSKAAETVAGWISDFLHFSLPEKGPLSDMDKSMPDMIDLMSKGIYSNKYKLINATNKLSQELKDKIMLDNINLDNLMKMQGNITSKTIDKSKTIFTTPQIVFNVQELDEDKLEQCFNYINRKFGSQY